MIVDDRLKPTDDENDQNVYRITEALKRISAGLKRIEISSFDEPAHLFKPEVVNDKE